VLAPPLNRALAEFRKMQISREILGILTFSDYFSCVDHGSGTPLASYASQSQRATAGHRGDSLGYTLFEEGLRS